MNQEYKGYLKIFFSPAVAAIIDRLLLHPLDNVVSVQQVHNIGFLGAMQGILKGGSYRGFYRGLKWPLINAIPDRLSMYGIYFYFRDFYFQDRNIAKGPQLYIFSALVSALIDTLIICPSETYRQRKLFDIKSSSPLFIRAYKGYWALLLKGMVANTITLAGTDYIVFKTGRQESTSAALSVGLLIGASGQIVITPLDYIKTMAMTNFSGKPFSKVFYENFNITNAYKSLPGRILRIGLGTGIVIGAIKFIDNKIDNFLE